MEVAVTNYGCAILSIMVPDKNGKYANVILCLLYTSKKVLQVEMFGPVHPTVNIACKDLYSLRGAK